MIKQQVKNVTEVYTRELQYHDYLLKIAAKYPKVKFVLYTGGSDVSPELYQQPNLACYGCNSRRDLEETEVFKMNLKDSQKHKIINIGICRGAQFLCVMNGGSLIQHVNNHGGSPHMIECHDGQSYEVTSAHHQMMYPYDLPKEDYRLLGSSISLSTTYIDGYGEKVDKASGILLKDIKNFNEPEVVYFPKTNALCIQSHPEYDYLDQSQFHKYIEKTVEEILNNEL